MLCYEDKSLEYVIHNLHGKREIKKWQRKILTNKIESMNSLLN